MEPDEISLYASAYHQENNFSTACMSVGQINSRGIFHGYDPLNYSLPLLLIQLSLASLVILLPSRLLKPLGQPSTVAQILVSHNFPHAFFPFPQQLAFMETQGHLCIHIDNICICV